ncbi:MAG: hypothetical protein MOGMAGMI_00314 [Candidatus Omnitrophica bacterium]|nr:hypothetical protein [Candidatus Omnitrophota bacterium]
MNLTKTQENVINKVLKNEELTDSEKKTLQSVLVQLVQKKPEFLKSNEEFSDCEDGWISIKEEEEDGYPFL